MGLLARAARTAIIALPIVAALSFGQGADARPKNQFDTGCTCSCLGGSNGSPSETFATPLSHSCGDLNGLTCNFQKADGTIRQGVLGVCVANKGTGGTTPGKTSLPQPYVPPKDNAPPRSNPDPLHPNAAQGSHSSTTTP